MSGDAADSQEHAPAASDQGQADKNSRRSFLATSAKRAAYIAPIIWSISAQQALAGSDDSSAFGTGGGGGGPPPPE